VLKTGVSYFGSRIQRHVKDDMQDIARHHCNFVVHTFSELDLQYYRGTMKEIVRLSRRAGLEVWIDPWAVGGVFGGEHYSRFVMENTDACQVSAATSQSLPAACLNNKKFRDFMFSWVDAALEIGSDVFFWDEPHFYLYPLGRMEKDPVLWACRCGVCRRKFKKIFGYEMPRKLNDDIKLFKEDCIVEFLETMCDYVKASDQPLDYARDGSRDGEPVEPRPATPPTPRLRRAGSDIKNAVCLLPFKGALGGIMDWSKPARIASLDIIGTDPYWKAGERNVAGMVGNFSKKIYDLAKRFDKEGQIWILNFRIRRGTEADIGGAITAAYREGIHNLAAWSYGGTGCISFLTSDEPAKVWDTLGREYARLHRMSVRQGR